MPQLGFCLGLHIVERLVVSVDVEKDGGQDTSLWQAVLLFSPSATLIVQFHIEPPTGQHVVEFLY